jgi:pimeloyl-ACP methyl ester carboxylesterase
MRCTLQENADRLASYCAALECDTLHLVGHSLGGLVALHAVACDRIAKPGRLVLAGTPFAESFSAQRLSRLPGGHTLLGKCVREWLHAAPRLATSGREIGVIAGDLSFGLGRVIAPDLPAPNDGVVRVEETRVPGMRDHLVLHVSHTAMLFAPSVAHAVCAFLRHGRFGSDGSNESEHSPGTSKRS